ncbi:Rho guanine nucleotide exchange factor [Marasmius sp. AFHP31]|nr:Rho guanine nucleotide exchange factor [Marasmius sp. AFHP31]
MPKPTSLLSQSASISPSTSTFKPGSREAQAVEPDEQWKEELHVKIEKTFMPLVAEAEMKKENDLRESPKDRVRIEREFQSIMAMVRRLAKEQFLEELKREREERASTLGLNMGPKWQNVSKEQQAIPKEIQSSQGSTANTGSSARDDGQSKQEDPGSVIETSISSPASRPTPSTSPMQSTSIGPQSSDRTAEKPVHTATPLPTQSLSSSRAKTPFSKPEPLSVQEVTRDEEPYRPSQSDRQPERSASSKYERWIPSVVENTPDRTVQKPVHRPPERSVSSKFERWMPSAAEATPSPPQRKYHSPSPGPSLLPSSSPAETPPVASESSRPPHHTHGKPYPGYPMSATLSYALEGYPNHPSSYSAVHPPPQYESRMRSRPSNDTFHQPHPPPGNSPAVPIHYYPPPPPPPPPAHKQREEIKGETLLRTKVIGPQGIQTDEEFERIQGFLEDAKKCRKVLETEGDEAQRWLDLLQVLADYPGVLRQSRSTIFKIMLRLSRKSGMYPRCLKINNVEKLSLYPVAGGGFGDVWKGKIANEIVGLKVVKVYLASDVEQLLKEYMQEAIVWQQLRHPNLLPFVGMYYFGEGQEQLCLVSPWMEQGNLVTFLKNVPPEHVDRMLLAYDVASGLAHLHDMKIVHGDMKAVEAGQPLEQVNVFITPEGRAAIGDFGLSHVADSHALKLSTSFTSRAKGTTRWLAPELLDPELSIISTSKSDMYAYGCVCYEIFAGHPPFHGLTDGAVVVAVLVKQRYPSRPEGLEDDAIWELMTSCWNHNSSLRPTAADALKRIRNLLSIRDGIPDAPDWKAFAIDAIRSNVEYPSLDLGMLTQL